jgi:Spherulation-specific family 4
MRFSCEKSHGSIIWVSIFISLLAVLSNASRQASAASGTTPSTGVIVPLYAYPTDSTWATLIQEKQAHPGVPVVAIINPTRFGTGRYYDPNFASGVMSLQAAGITVVGYVATNYCARYVGWVETNIDRYKSWYAVNGMFFDEMPIYGGCEAYYSTLSGYAYSLGMSLTVGNPGATIDTSYIGTVNMLVVYEGSGEPSVSSLASRIAGYDKSNFAIIAYGVNSYSPSYVQSASRYLGYMYLTIGILPDPYTGVLPSYLDRMFSTLASLGGGSSSTVTVNSVDQNNNTIFGYYTTLWQNGNVIATGFTTKTFSTTAGQAYSIEADSYGSCTFTQWSDGVASDPRPFTATTGPLSLTAVYNCGTP